MKKALFCFIAVICAALSVNAANKKTFRPGEIWHDDRGIHINAHGGGVLFHKGTYYWFGEHKGERSNSALVGVTCYASKDLMNWTYKSVALPVVTDDPNHDITSGSTIERPKVVYNAKTGKFVMWFHLELKGRGYNAARSAVAVSDKAEGPYKYIGSLRPNAGFWPENMSEKERHDTISTKAFKKDWTNEWRQAVKEGMFTRRDFAGGQMARDMTVYVDDDGKAYHILASEENLTLNIAELSDDYLSHTGRYVRVEPAGHNEAPAIFKKDGKYFMITSGCTGWDPNAARLLIADSIWGPWTNVGNPCQGEGADLTFRSQSTYILKVEGKKDAFIFMADRWTPRTPIDGRYIWLPIIFEDGKPVLRWMDEWDMSFFKKK